MTDYLIYGVDSKGNRKRVALTTSARAAKTYRDREGGPWESIVVAVVDDELTVAELDQRAAAEDRLAKRF